MNTTTNTMPLNLQFFAEPAGEDTTTNNTAETNTEGTGANQDGKNDVDIEKAIEKGKEQKEQAILKSFYKQQGMTEEEIKEAIAAFKTQKAEKEKAEETAKVEAENAKEQAVKDAEAARDTAIQMLKNEKINASILSCSVSLGADPAKLSLISKLIDMDSISIDENYKVDEESTKAAIQKILDEVPEFKAKVTNTSSHGIRFGSQSNSNDSTNNTTKNMTYRQKLEAQLHSNMSK